MNPIRKLTLHAAEIYRVLQLTQAPAAPLYRATKEGMHLQEEPHTRSIPTRQQKRTRILSMLNRYTKKNGCIISPAHCLPGAPKMGRGHSGPRWPDLQQWKQLTAAFGLSAALPASMSDKLVQILHIRMENT